MLAPDVATCRTKRRTRKSIETEVAALHPLPVSLVAVITAADAACDT
jgi:hypothetical protein